MIKIENTCVSGFEAAIRGMRNPLNSWNKSDSTFDDHVTIGEADLSLMRRLAKAGTEHAKYLRMINVTCDITAPSYWVSEHDTMKIATVRNSCSFMHKGTSKEFETSDFSLSDDRVRMFLECNNCLPSFFEDDVDNDLVDAYKHVLHTLNALRERYLETKDDKYFVKIRELLPSGWLIRYTWQANYQVLHNIDVQRKGHRLKEWADFRNWIHSLPYYNEIFEEVK